MKQIAYFPHIKKKENENNENFDFFFVEADVSLTEVKNVCIFFTLNTQSN